MGAAVAHARPPHPPGQARPRTAAPARLRRVAPRRSGQPAGRRHRRAPPRRDPRLPQAIKGSTTWWLTVRYGKRGRTRSVPLDEDALDAITAWVKSRPAAATEHLLLSLPRTAPT